MKLSQIKIEKHREFWIKIAKANGWYIEPFYVQVWTDKSGNITDSVSHTSLIEDIVIEE
ncbi:MAG: hypothetical protein PWQ10_458 [Patescibacteria group bacterium]|nr:hypothetical protein [Patescibacteria group bacterium]MDP3443867.1 hypothetical protein [Ignavibacteria bacterium]